jgi:hypothetical protein
MDIGVRERTAAIPGLMLITVESRGVPVFNPRTAGSIPDQQSMHNAVSLRSLRSCTFNYLARQESYHNHI